VIARFVLEDEVTGNGSLLCLEKYPHADAAIIIDGTRGDRGINEHAGNLKMQLNVSGKPASVGVSHVGRNAAEILAHTMLVLKQSVSELNSSIEPPWTQFPSPNQLSTIALKCEETTLTVPSAASATLYATFIPPHTVSSFLDLISAKSREAARQAGADCAPEINVDFAAEPVRSKSSAIECVISRAAGRDIAFGPSTGTSDMRHFIRYSVPCVLFGPGRGYNPHRANEHFELRSLKEMTELLTDVALCWCK
jgi:acetylornithine deacetylase